MAFAKRPLLSRIIVKAVEEQATGISAPIKKKCIIGTLTGMSKGTDTPDSNASTTEGEDIAREAVERGLDPELPITLIYGSLSWIDSTTGDRIRELRGDSPTFVEVIPGAGHHVYAEQTELFVEAVLRSANRLRRTNPTSEDPAKSA